MNGNNKSLSLNYASYSDSFPRTGLIFIISSSLGNLVGRITTCYHALHDEGIFTFSFTSYHSISFLSTGLQHYNPFLHCHGRHIQHVGIIKKNIVFFKLFFVT